MHLFVVKKRERERETEAKNKMKLAAAHVWSIPNLRSFTIFLLKDRKVRTGQKGASEEGKKGNSPALRAGREELRDCTFRGFLHIIVCDGDNLQKDK